MRGRKPKPSAKAEWQRLARELYQLGIITRLDRATLAGYCQSYARWIEAAASLHRRPARRK